MGCVHAWSAHGDLWWKNFASYSGKLGQAGISERKGRGNDKAAGRDDKSSLYDFSPLVVGGGAVSRLMSLQG
jgi:hypothetical protein